jgi:hypothetical protein
VAQDRGAGVMSNNLPKKARRQHLEAVLKTLRAQAERGLQPARRASATKLYQVHLPAGGRQGSF